MYNIFPKELWISILLDLPCKYVRNFRDINAISKNLCDTENLVHMTKIKGFPRNNERCKFHDISRYDGSFYHNNIMIKSNFSKELWNAGCEYSKIFRPISIAVIDKLYENNVDLVAGDIINFGGNVGLKLFDGETIIDTKLYSEIIIPGYLCPIRNNIPVEYWTSRSEFNGKFIFNIGNLRNLLLEHISYNEHKIIYTWFVLNNIEYIFYTPVYNECFKHKLLEADDIRLYLDNKSIHTFKINNKIVENVYMSSSLDK